MNPTIETILNRKSVRAYEDKPIPQDVKDAVLAATLRAPTAGNQMLYSIIEVNDPAAKATLVKTCDNQPFIAAAPWVLLFLADYQRWHDYFLACGVEQLCAERNIPLRAPEEGDLFLACCDALIAAQTAVIAAEAFGLGSCYIGDILENCEAHQKLFNLPRYVFPITLLCLGYSTQGQKERALTPRFDPRYIVFQDQYRRLDKPEFEEMYRTGHERVFKDRVEIEGATNIGQLVYLRKFSAAFSVEMSRSVRVLLQAWKNQVLREG